VFVAVSNFPPFPPGLMKGPVNMEKLTKNHIMFDEPGNTKGESITVPLTSCLIGLD
jgi:hypothetical protein